MDSHPVDVCRTVRYHDKPRLEGYGKKGYCASLKRWFIGVREHLIVTPDGYIMHLEELAGNRHDVNGLYALLKTPFKGKILADNAYWPEFKKCLKLEAKGIAITAQTRKNWHFQYNDEYKEFLRINRAPIERRIGLFNEQFHADRTLCRSFKHFLARRWVKALSHNASRRINQAHEWPTESLSHFHAAA